MSQRNKLSITCYTLCARPYLHTANRTYIAQKQAILVSAHCQQSGDRAIVLSFSKINNCASVIQKTLNVSLLLGLAVSF
eukprot:jgi/Botrbrau1/19437/Bobra.0338s0059.1